MRLLLIIPARGGSKRIPRKALRPIEGIPLICHTLFNASSAAVDLEDSGHDVRIVVATDDALIAEVAQGTGLECDIVMRETVPDDQPVTAVVAEVLAGLHSEVWAATRQGSQQSLHECGYDAVGIVQSTAWDAHGQLSNLIEGFLGDEGVGSATTVNAVRHHHWTNDGPVYPERVNSQELSPALWAENGLLHICWDWPRLEAGAGIGGAASEMIGVPHRLLECDPPIVDIDTYDDLEVVRTSSRRSTIQIRVCGGHEVGSGHVRRQLAMADLLSDHDIAFSVCAHADDWVADYIATAGWEVVDLDPGDGDLAIIDDPHLTSVELAIRETDGLRYLTFENHIDPNAVNALADEGTFSGPRWFLPRPEFLGYGPYPFEENDERSRIVVTFGGTDPGEMTEQVVDSLVMAGCDDTLIDVVSPPMSPRPVTTSRGVQHWMPPSMATLYRQAALVITSQGRTVLEAALVGAPVLSVAVNRWEEQHARIPGPMYLGLRHTLSSDMIANAAMELLARPKELTRMSIEGRQAVDGLGGDRLRRLVDDILDGLI